MNVKSSFKRWLGRTLLILFGAVISLTFKFLYNKSQKPPRTYQTETATTKDIVKKTVATGAIVPREEVEIKPRVSGVLEEIWVEPNSKVKKGDRIAKIRIVPNAQNLNAAESSVRSAKIAADNAKRELDRNQALYTQGVIPEAELARFKTEYALRKADHESASQQLQIVRDGQTRGGGASSNVVVTSTVDGMIIDVPVKVGFSVIESNNFNPGTTIATVADMNDMIFQGQVDESEVGKLVVSTEKPQDLRIKIGAIEAEQFDGKLEYISPKGKEIDGAIQFEIKGKLIRKGDQFIRANYSANADIVLEEKKQVMAIREALVQYDPAKPGDAGSAGPKAKGKPFVEVETGKAQVFARRDVELGLSDGINVEVLSGITATDKIKVPDNAGPAGMPGSGRGGGGK
jgi:HlyD family secretion protein